MPAHRVPPAPRSLELLRQVAARQGGVVTWRQGLSAGLTASQLRTLVRRGGWQDGGHGLLVQAEVPHSYLADVARRFMALSRRSVISHASAGLLLGFPYVDRPPLPTLTVERGHRGLPGVYVGELVGSDVTHLGGLPITTHARTLVDLLRTAPNRLVAQALADGVRHHRVDVGGVDEVLLACSGWPGIKQARETWARADARIESPLESRCRVWFLDGALPDPEPQVVVGDAHRSARVDFLFRAHDTVVESDGRLKYESPGSLWAEKQREDWLRDMGFEVVRATWADGRDGGAALVRRVRAAFARNARRAA